MNNEFVRWLKRYEEGHAIRHWRDTQHCYSLELETQQIWDYVGDKYVHRLNQSKPDGKSVVKNFRCVSLNGECGTCDDNEDSGYGGALLSSKVDEVIYYLPVYNGLVFTFCHINSVCTWQQIANEYNHLLATEMEKQRQVCNALNVHLLVSGSWCINDFVILTIDGFQMHGLQYAIIKSNCYCFLLLKLL